MIMIIIANNNIQIGYYRKRGSVNGHTQTVGWINNFSCRSIVFYVLYVTFSLFVINLIRMLVTSRAITYSPVVYGQYNNLIM